MPSNPPAAPADDAAAPDEFGSVPGDATPLHSGEESPRVRDILTDATMMRVELLAGLVVALALIPEAISFAVLAGVDPAVGLYAAFTMAVVTAIAGGRPAMVSGSTGAIALVVAPLAESHGLSYLLAAVALGGIVQVALSAAGAARLMRFVPRSVMIGFVNALAILIFMAQVPELIDVPFAVYPMVAVGIATLVLLPRVTTAVPAPLVVIVVATILAVALGLDLPTVGDKGALPDSLPSFGFPDVPFSLDTLRILAPYAFGVALVGLLESLMTAKLVDDITDTGSDKTREARGQGIANIVTALFGGMGGCAMIGQSMINVKASGARTRLSNGSAGVFLLVLVVAFGPVVSRIPIAALVAVMIMVSVSTMDWHSLNPETIRRMPTSITVIMIVTVATTVLTHNLAYGVIAGVIVAMIYFARRVAHFTEVVDVAHPDANTRVYAVKGVMFFASSNDLVYQFDYAGDPDNVIIDLSEAQIYDSSTVATLDAIRTKYAKRNKHVEIIGMNEASAQWHELSGNLGAGH